MAPEVANIADRNRQVPTWLPLNIESLVESVGQFVLSVVIRKREELRAVGNGQSDGRMPKVMPPEVRPADLLPGLLPRL